MDNGQCIPHKYNNFKKGLRITSNPFKKQNVVFNKRFKRRKGNKNYGKKRNNFTLNISGVDCKKRIIRINE